MKFDKRGRELPDATPIAVPLGARKPESLVEMMRRLIRQDMSLHAADQGRETFDEANDFEVPDEDPELNPTEFETMADEVPRGHAQAREAEDEEEARPASRRKKRREEDDEDDEPPPAKRHREDESDGDEVPRKKEESRPARASSRTRVPRSRQNPRKEVEEE